ncbi:MAG: rhomboid family intramembrane serine protease [Bacteroidales bacterium]|nr:MAG: rhomboid family intramembrane serine protease [Bacteroidales bacterium]
MALTDEIRQSFKRGSILTKLIYINLGIFLAINILYILYILINPAGISRIELNAYFQTKFLTYLMVPANISKLIIKPWTLFTYMFLHFNFLHILFNLIWLFLFGRIFLKYLNEKQLLSTYILGGLSGAFLFIFFYNVFPGLIPYAEQSEMLGASAGVMAIAMGICFYVPNFAVYVPLIGPVKLKYIAVFFIITDILQIASYNAGGHIAHLGGVIYGYFFVQQYRKGKDLGKGLNSILDSIASLFRIRKKRMKVSYKRSAKDMTDMEYNRSKAQTQEEVDRILDKIAKSGYDSLTKSEKETLFKMSNKS